MIIMKKYIKYVIFVLFILLCIGITIFLGKNKENNFENNIFISELLVYKDGKEYEIRVNNKTKETILRVDDKEEVIYRYPREGSPRVSIPDFENIEGSNVIKDMKTYIDYTYNVSYQKGCEYIKYLMEDGYVFKQYMANSQYFECFLEKEGNVKRVILFIDSLMVCDLIEDASLPEISNYFTRYNFDGKIEDKLS